MSDARPGSRNVTAAAGLIIFALAGIGLISCFSDRQTATGPVQQAGECRVPLPSPAAGTVVVFIRDFTFIPTIVTVKRGTKVTWVNCENTGLDSHTSTSDGGLWDSPSLRPGEAYSRTFNDATGTVFDYHCVPHPFMKGTVNVE